MDYKELEQEYLKMKMAERMRSKIDFLNEELISNNVTVKIEILNEIHEDKPLMLGIEITPNCPNELAEKIRKVYGATQVQNKGLNTN